MMRADLAMDYTTCELPLACILNQIRLDAISTANCRRCSSSITLYSLSVLSIQVRDKTYFRPYIFTRFPLWSLTFFFTAFSPCLEKRLLF